MFHTMKLLSPFGCRVIVAELKPRVLCWGFFVLPFSDGPGSESSVLHSHMHHEGVRARAWRYLVRGSSSALALSSSQLFRGALPLRHPPDPLLLLFRRAAQTQTEQHPSETNRANGTTRLKRLTSTSPGPNCLHLSLRSSRHLQLQWWW